MSSRKRREREISCNNQMFRFADDMQTTTQLRLAFGGKLVTYAGGQ